MSAEERLAALLHDLRSEPGRCDHAMKPSDCVRFARRLIAAGVSVPTEPGAPDLDPERLADAIYNAGYSLFDDETRDHVNEEKAIPAIVREYAAAAPLRAALASQPVPAPEPSARLDVERLHRALLAASWPGGVMGGLTRHAAEAIAAEYAATPQDPEA